MEPGKISYENAKRMKQRRQKVENMLFVKSVEMQESGLYRDEMFAKIEEQNRRSLNKAIYDFAERTGRNLYDICLQYMPEYSEAQIKHEGDMVYLDQDVRLVPMPMDLEEGPGYWKSKYYRLKEHLQELIDNKED